MPLSAQQLAAQKNLSYVLAEKLAQRIDPECAVGHFPHPDHYAASLHLHGSDDRLSVDGV